MGFFNTNSMRVDPDHRQDHSNGKCITLSMAQEEVWAEYGKPSEVKRQKGFLITQSDLVRVMERRRVKKDNENRLSRR